ncbi:hypothetical protein CVIRNUC_010293 [Coccomyxa viridis]|uniref:Uncharacterized protein n=1 Tax=Coccomyxa viridis TaxID=1274662 RepID=A0AAV1ILI8_9CHLO|nr:hypothetical protein CVIRNUC_010293 [Coccomyxa viridis]
MQLLQSTSCATPFTTASQPKILRREQACRVVVSEQAHNSRPSHLSRRQASGALLAAMSLAALQGPAQAANAFLSPEARSKDLAKKETRRKAELKEKYAKLRAQEGGQAAPVASEQASG